MEGEIDTDVQPVTVAQQDAAVDTQQEADPFVDERFEDPSADGFEVATDVLNESTKKQPKQTKKKGKTLEATVRGREGKAVQKITFGNDLIRGVVYALGQNRKDATGVIFKQGIQRDASGKLMQ